MEHARFSCAQCGEEIIITRKTLAAARREANRQKKNGEICFECRCKKQEAELASLPALKGSEKQIAWADQIRKEFLQMPLDDDLHQWLCEQTSAKLFIENRMPNQIKKAFKASLVQETEVKEEVEEEKESNEKVEWKKFECNIQNIVFETKRAYRIKMPYNSRYNGFNFWVSKKLCRNGSHSYAMLISVASDMYFKLQRSGKTGVIEEKIATQEEMLEAFGGEQVGFVGTDIIETVRHTPTTLLPEKVEVDETLIKQSARSH